MAQKMFKIRNMASVYELCFKLKAIRHSIGAKSNTIKKKQLTFDTQKKFEAEPRKKESGTEGPLSQKIL